MTAMPPDTKQRKADVGERIVFCLDSNGHSQYFAHLNHCATVEDVVLTHEKHRGAPRATYTVACECGLVLHPRSTAFTVTADS
jgi:hypothetical protein